MSPMRMRRLITKDMTGLSPMAGVGGGGERDGVVWVRVVCVGEALVEVIIESFRTFVAVGGKSRRFLELLHS